MPEPPSAEPEAAAPPTPGPTLAEREVTILRTLEQLSVQRARAEADTERAYAARKQAEEKAYQKAIEDVTAAYKTESQSIQARYQSVRKGIVAQYQTERQAIEAEEAEVRKKTTARSNSARKSAKKEHEDSRWQALAVYEGSKGDAVKRFKQFELELKNADAEYQHVRDDAEYILFECRKYIDKAPESASVVEGVAAPASEPTTAVDTAPAPAEEGAAAPAPEPETAAAPLSEGSATPPKEPTT